MRSPTRWLACTSVVAAFTCVLAPDAGAQNLSFQTIDVPGAIYTIVNGINNAGDAVGEYMDENYNQHGFLWSGGQFTTIDVPEATGGTMAFDINNQRQIVGSYSVFENSTPYIRSFILSGGSFTTFTVGTVETWASGINNNGDVVGWYRNNAEGNSVGFLRAQAGGVTIIDAQPGMEMTIATDIDDSGTVVGFSGGGNFFWNGGFTNFYENCLPMASTKIDNTGRVVGTDSSATICSATHVWEYSVPVPNAWTGANAINDVGFVAGSYYDETWSQLHGFIGPLQPVALRLTLNAFIPFDHIDDPHPYFGHDRVLEGDGATRTWDENGSSRVSQIMDIWNQSLGANGIFLSNPVDWSNISQQYQTSTSLDNDLITAEARNDWEWDEPLKTAWGVPVNQEEGCSGYLIYPTTVGVSCDQKTPNGVYPAWLDPAIEWHFDLTFGFTSSTLVNYSILGCRKYFPAYEVWAAGELIYGGTNSENPAWIMVPCDLAVTIEQTGTVTLD